MRISDWSSDVCSSDLGSSRRAFEAKARREEVIRSNELLRLQQQLDHRRKKLEAQIEVLRTDLRSDELELERLIAAETAHLKQAIVDEGEMRASRRRSEEHTSELQSLMPNSYAV